MVHHEKGNPKRDFLFRFTEFSTGVEGGSRFARAKRFAERKRMLQKGSMAKDAVDNGGAGRAAKGAIPVDRTKQE